MKSLFKYCLTSLIFFSAPLFASDSTETLDSLPAEDIHKEIDAEDVFARTFKCIDCVGHFVRSEAFREVEQNISRIVEELRPYLPTAGSTQLKQAATKVAVTLTCCDRLRKKSYLPLTHYLNKVLGLKLKDTRGFIEHESSVCSLYIPVREGKAGYEPAEKELCIIQISTPCWPVEPKDISTHDHRARLESEAVFFATAAHRLITKYQSHLDAAQEELLISKAEIDKEFDEVLKEIESGAVGEPELEAHQELARDMKTVANKLTLINLLQRLLKQKMEGQEINRIITSYEEGILYNYTLSAPEEELDV